MTNHDPESSWTPTLSTVNPMYRSFSCSTHETTVPERSRTTADEMCPLYSAPKKHTSQVMSLDGITHLKASHFVRTKLKHHTFIPKESDCNFSASGALLVLSVLAILLSGKYIITGMLTSIEQPVSVSAIFFCRVTHTARSILTHSSSFVYAVCVACFGEIKFKSYVGSQI